MVTVHLRLPAPLPTQVLDLPGSTELGALLPAGWESQAYLRTRSSGPLSLSAPLASLAHVGAPSHPVSIDVVARLLGGKGGFGAQLRAAGGRMSGGKNDNVDSCRDLNGRRLGSIKEAKKKSELVESLPALRAKAAAETKAKLEALERKLGVSSDAIDAKADGAGAKRLAEVDLEELARKKHKFDDNKFMEESREINENVRSAVAAALLKKKKKKTDAAKQDKDKASMPPPKVAATSA
ncbi:hypothetical protein Q8F55_000836 [Vanrija albida]|uniref:SDE2-like domain-containing protein n=1 Tax=Vanrija albida TaxID=181172 RepID=A0ABR3QEX6_9TREE